MSDQRGSGGAAVGIVIGIILVLLLLGVGGGVMLITRSRNAALEAERAAVIAQERQLRAEALATATLDEEAGLANEGSASTSLRITRAGPSVLVLDEEGRWIYLPPHAPDTRPAIVFGRAGAPWPRPGESSIALWDHRGQGGTMAVREGQIHVVARGTLVTGPIAAADPQLDSLVSRLATPGASFDAELARLSVGDRGLRAAWKGR